MAESDDRSMGTTGDPEAGDRDRSVQPSDVEEVEKQEKKRPFGVYESTLHDEPTGAGDDSWIISYADMVTLLLTFFVMMLIVATFGREKLPDVIKALGRVVPIEQPATPEATESRARVIPEKVPEPQPTEALEPKKAPTGERDALIQELRKDFQSQDLKDLIEVEVAENRLNLKINESVLFALGRAELSGEGKHVLDRIAPTLNKGGFGIIVEGHTDDIPIGTERFPSNWELSAVRASTVVRHLIEQGIQPQRLRATGFADTSPVAGNDTSAGRKQNRRVNLVLEIGDKAAAIKN